MRPRAEERGPDAHQRRPLGRRRLGIGGHAHRQLGQRQSRPSSAARRGAPRRAGSAAAATSRRPAPWSSGPPRWRHAARAAPHQLAPGVAGLLGEPFGAEPHAPSGGAGVDLQQQAGPVPSSWAIRSIRCSSSSESTEWIAPNARSARRTLFDCRRPTMCHSAPGTASTLGSASWTRLSPNTVRPAACAACTAATSKPFVTATRRKPIGVVPGPFGRGAQAAHQGRDPVADQRRRDRRLIDRQHRSSLASRARRRPGRRPGRIGAVGDLRRPCGAGSTGCPGRSRRRPAAPRGSAPAGARWW